MCHFFVVVTAKSAFEFHHDSKIFLMSRVKERVHILTGPWEAKEKNGTIEHNAFPSIVRRIDVWLC